MRKLYLYVILLAWTSSAFGQGAQHDGIRARGSISNTQTYIITGATPNVVIGNVFKTNNGGAVTITNFLGGVDSQQITILCGESNTIIQNNANIAITGGTNFTCVLNNAISFVFNSASGVWGEIGGTGTGGGGGSSPGAPAQSFQCNDGAGHFVACQSTPGGALLNGTVGGTPNFGPLGNEALKPGTSDSVMYASVNGNDSNDGLSWGTAKLTIFGAMIALPGGNGSSIAGSGTIYVGPGTHAHPTAGVGIWFMGGGDPNYASPPAGWVKYVGGSIELIGVGATTPGILVGDVPYVPIVAGSSVDRNHPSLWLTGAQGIFKPKNIAFVGSQRPIVLGECSNNSRTTGGCVVFGFTLDGNKAVVTRVDGNSGPTIDAPQVTAVRIINSTLVGTAGSVTQLVDNEANILQGTATNVAGGVEVENVQMFYGGIKVLGNGQGTLFTHNVDEYGDFVHPMPPVIWYTNWNALSAGAHWNTTRQDPVPVQLIIRVDTPTCPFCPGPTVIGGFETNSIQGPATTFLNSPYYSSQAVNQTILGGKIGIINNYLFAESNLARRIAGLVPVRFTNQSFANSSLYTSAGNTITLSQPDSFGGTGAVKVHTVNVGGQNLLLSPAVAYTPQNGDWIIGGFWVRQQTPFVQVPVQAGVLNTGTATVGVTKNQGGPDQGDGEWQWNYTAKKVTANSAATTVQLSATFLSANDVFVYGPVLYIIPAAQITDDEALWLAQSVNTHDTACGVGSVCNTVGHPLQLAPDTFAKLGTPPDGTVTFCADCQITNPCLSGGAGAYAKRISGAWVCTDGNVNSNLFHSFFPGALTATWTGGTWTLTRAVIVTRIQAQLRVAPAGCSVSPIFRLTDGSTPLNLTLSAASNDSGVISQSYAAGTVFTTSIQTAASGCTTSPGDANVAVQYRMQ